MHPKDLRRSLIRVMPLLVAGLTILVLLIYYQQVTRIKHTTFKNLVLENQQRALASLDQLLTPVSTNLSIVAEWLKEEMPRAGEIERLNARLIPILKEIPQVASAVIASDEGAEYMLQRTQGGWLTRVRESHEGTNRFQWSRWSTAREPVEQWNESTDYDPRDRPWFQGALETAEPDTLFWTSPYRFFSSGQPGLSVARRITREGTSRFLVVAFDVLLADISALTSNLVAEDDGIAFALTADDQIIGVPRDTQFETEAAIQEAMLTPVQSFSVPIVRQAYATWSDDGRPVATPFRVRGMDDSKDWWASVWDYGMGNQSLWLGVAIPEPALVKRMGGPWLGIPAAILATGLILLLVTLWLVRKTGKSEGEQLLPGSALFLSGDTDDDPANILQETIQRGESEFLEFKSTLRWNFKAGRTGKEIELAWLKTVAAFLNSGGGLILLGVNDQGDVLGLDNDGFANDDALLRHVENLVAQHLGSVHFPAIQSRLFTVAQKQVLAIKCGVAQQPVFLKQGKAEDFYIRTGPASRSLSPSEVLTYLEMRKVQR
ncbi:MAG: putative DNA binding domain-containing protein [Gammaproteobacteria bacterium]|nr:putative DNA binding domain-containing protein [Gammaproteobacteria bacterium]